MPATPSSAARPTPAEPTGALDRFFEITRRGSTIGGEIRGGLVTFVTMLASKLLSPVYSTVTPLVLLQSSKTFCRASASEPVIPPAIRTVPPAAADPPVLPPLLPPSAQPARANAATPMTARGAIQRRRDIPM